MYFSIIHSWETAGRARDAASASKAAQPVGGVLLDHCGASEASWNHGLLYKHQIYYNHWNGATNYYLFIYLLLLGVIRYGEIAIEYNVQI